MKSQAAFAALACLIFAAGCGPKRDYGLAPVSGVITLDGKPVPKAFVSLQPRGGGKLNPGPGSVGICDETGRYELKTIRGEPGAVPGPHAVRVTSPKAAPGDEDRDDEPGPAQAELFPAKYNIRTELSLEVPPDGTDAANFDLTSK